MALNPRHTSGQSNGQSNGQGNGHAAPVESGDGDVLPPEGLNLREHIARIERNLIRQALKRRGGVVAHAARLLGLRRTTLVEKLRKHRISAHELEPSLP